MSQETLNRSEVMVDFKEGRLSRKGVAAVLKISERTVSRIFRRWQDHGILGLEHRLVGRRAINRIDDETRELVVTLLKGKYSGFNIRHFYECIIEKEKILNVSYSSLKRIAKSMGLGKCNRRPARARRRRNRFAQEGYMLQMDGSSHIWWKGQVSCLISGIDDATSDVAYGEFFPTETLEGYMKVLRRIIELRGIPRLIYIDRASWLSGICDDDKGQFNRICGELNIRIIRAQSAQGKGRIERLWGTLQDRLVSEFRLNGIDTDEKANVYLNCQFLIETWEKKFTVESKNVGKAYRACPRKQELDQIFCLKIYRTIRNDHTLLLANEVWGITADLPHSIAKKRAEIRIFNNGSIEGYYGAKDLKLKRERKGSWTRHEIKNKNIGRTLWESMQVSIESKCEKPQRIGPKVSRPRIDLQLRSVGTESLMESKLRGSY